MSDIDPPLAGRWRLLDPIGVGTAGTVYRAEDAVTGALVAVKVLADATPIRLGRFDREARALKRLGAPGVVRLLDEGEHEGRRFLVTELLDGAPFPGAVAGPVPWARLRATAVQLLETLAAVHAAGVLHRDLKPANVLVDALGRPTVLDFGLARMAGEESLTRTGDVLGTPRYQAPEQILGDHPVDPRTDLYAVGAMLYEALAGRPPQHVSTLGRVYAARLVRDPPPLAEVAPDVPSVVAQVVDRLVARAPESRPGSARAVLAALAAAAPARPAGALPWLGPSAPVDRVREALRAGRPVIVAGPRGSGRSRVIGDAAAGLAERTVRRVPAGERPFESLAAAVGRPLAGPEDAAAAVRGGDVFVVDEDEGIDPWSARCLAEASAPVVWAGLADGGADGGGADGGGADGGVIAASAEAGAVGSGAVGSGGVACGSVAGVGAAEPGGAVGEVVERVLLDPLTADALAPLFTGPAREARKAAALLAARTRGLPARVAAEVGRWVAEGLATWTPEGLAFAPEARFVVAAGPAPDVRLGRRGRLPLPPALDTALAWIALAEPWADVGTLAAARGRPTWEIEAEARELAAAGAIARGPEGFAARPDLAGVMEGGGGARREALRALAEATAPGSPGRLGRLYAAEDWGAAVAEARRVGEAAFERGDVAAAWGAAACGVAAALEGDLAGEAPLALLVRAAAGVGTMGILDAAAERIGRVAARLGDDEDVARARAILAAARAGPLARGATAGGRRGDARPHPDGAGRRAGATSLADGDARRADAKPLPDLDARLADAEVLLEAGDLAAAAREATAVEVEADRLGRVALAAHAAVVRRDADVRAGAELAASPANVAAAEAIGLPWLLARACLVEAAAAWRATRYDLAARLARRAANVAPEGAVSVLARALVLASGSAGSGAACASVVADADRLGAPGVALQVRGLVALAAPGLSDDVLPSAEALARALGGLPETGAVLSPAEALAFCRVGARRAPSG